MAGLALGKELMGSSRQKPSQSDWKWVERGSMKRGGPTCYRTGDRAVLLQTWYVAQAKGRMTEVDAEVIRAAPSATRSTGRAVPPYASSSVLVDQDVWPSAQGGTWAELPYRDVSLMLPPQWVLRAEH